MHAVQHALEVDGDDAVPRLLGALDERLQLVPAGVVHEDIDRAERAPGCGHGLADAGGVRHVAADGERAGADGGRDLAGGRGIEIEDGDLRAGAAEA